MREIRPSGLKRGKAPVHAGPFLLHRPFVVETPVLLRALHLSLNRFSFSPDVSFRIAFSSTSVGSAGDPSSLRR